MHARRCRKQISLFTLLTCVVLTAAGAAHGQGADMGGMGTMVTFGAGSASTYSEFDSAGAPAVIGFRFGAAGLNAPPAGPSDMHHCVDRNGDGTVDKPSECNMTHEFPVALPADIASRDDVPFKWVLMNWNPMGHIPPGIYDTPHFDIHFMIEPKDSIFSIAPGMCGPEFVDCDQFAMGRMALPANYAPANFKDVAAVVPAMGNHLVDVTGPEFSGEPFTRSWIYGTYDGRVTFYEEMLTLKYILSRPNKCNAIESSEAVAVAGFYPTESCVRYDEGSDSYTISLEDFHYREASAPGELVSRELPPPPDQPPASEN